MNKNPSGSEDKLEISISFTTDELHAVHLKGGDVDPKALNTLIRERVTSAILKHYHGIEGNDLPTARKEFRITYMRKYPWPHLGVRPVIIMRYQYGKSRRIRTMRLQFEPLNGTSTLTGRFHT